MSAIAPGPTLPPQDLDAEQSLLGAMMLSESAVDIATEIVRPNDFYRESHSVVFTAVQSLYGKNSPVDQITVADELATQGKLDDVGGTPFIYSLADAIPAVANVRRYAEIVHDLAVIRRLIAAGMEIAQLGYERSGTAAELVDKAESIVFDVAQDRTQDGLTPIKGLLVEEFARIEKLAESGSDVTGVPTGLKSLDRLLSGFQDSNLLILAARPGMGKTSLALGFARFVGVEANLPVAVFSLEMSRHEVTQRLMCAEALVDSQNLRTGKMRQEDWGRLVAACDRLSRAPIYIDDTAGINVMEIRSKARRLKSQEKGLSLIIVDYLQLMQGATVSESRVQEISHISRSLKLLARDLDVPVMALSQLSRAVESRQDKRPILSDLRESGCVTGDTRVFLPESGTYERIDALVGREPFDVLAVSTDTWKLERATATRAFATGVKPVYRLRTRLGREVRATANHKFLTVSGWRRLDELSVGEQLALPASRPRELVVSAPRAISATHGGVATLNEAASGVVIDHDDIAWDAIASIEPAGTEPVYDLTVDELHNFVANDVIVHNSIEQDADVVMFIYRDEYYVKDSETNKGIAELIVAKHRSGATDAVELAFRQKYTLFSDLARGEA